MNSASEDKDITLTAAQWVVRLEGQPLTPGESAALDAWTQADSRHRAALEKARFAWTSLGAFGEDAGAALLPEHAHAASSHQIIAMPPPRVRRRWFVPAALAASIAFAVALGPQWLRAPDGHRTHIASAVQTAVGEQKRVTLPDGSIVILGPASALTPDYSASQRMVRLERGVAIFTAAPKQGQEKRPFVVTAGSGTVRALGTRFQVEFEPDGVEVAVIEHAVEVARLAAPKATARVEAGESVRYGKTGVSPVRRADAAIATAWQQGQLVFNERPLSEVVMRLNRYRRDQLVLAAGLDDRRVSGVFETANPDTALQLLKDQFGLRQREIAADKIQLY